MNINYIWVFLSRFIQLDGNTKISRIEFAWNAIISSFGQLVNFRECYTKIVLVIPMGIVIEGT